MGKAFMICEPSTEYKVKVQNAVETIRNKTSREIRCPYCKRIALVVYADSTGVVRTKCEKCKKEILVDLVSMRRINRR